MPNQEFRLPPLEWIRAFEAAARLGSFTAAAEETGFTQSAISQRIAHLERHLGTRLFHRRPRSIVMTIEAEAWLPHVRTSLSTLRESSQALFGAKGHKLTISASQSVIELWLMPRLHRLIGITAAEISIQTMVLGAHDAPQDEVIRIRYGAGDWPHPYKKQLFSERIMPVASPELAARDEHWTAAPRISYSGPRPGWNAWAAQFAIPTTPLSYLRFDTFVSALEAAKGGLGVLLASKPLCIAEITTGHLVQLGEDELPHHESYWMLAGHDALTREQWDALSTGVLQS